MNLTVELLSTIIGVVVVGVTGFVSLSRMIDRRIEPLQTSIAEMTTAIVELRVLLVGYPGNPNGLAGSVRQLEHDLKNIRQVLNGWPKGEDH